VRRRWQLLIVPLVASIALYVRRIDRVQTGPDAGVFRGLVRNLREHAALTSPTDQYWIRLTPAETVDRLGDIPVPDFGPLYPLAVAAVPAPHDVAFLAVHVLAAFVAVWAVGIVAERAAGSTLAACCAQIIALWGPFTPDLFFRHGRPLDVFGMIGSDGPATAWWLAGFAMLTATTPHRAAAAGLLSASTLTRYALAGPVGGLLAGLAWARARTGDRRWIAAAIAIAVPAVWQFLVYPLLISGSGPKSFAVHRGDIAPLGRTLAGWVNVDASGRVAATVVVLAVLVIAAVAALARPGGVVSLAAAASAGQVVVVAAGRQFLDAGLNLREERHLLLTRFLLAVLIVVGVRELVASLTRSLTWRRQAVAAAAPALVLAAVVLAGGWPGPDALRPRSGELAVDSWLHEHGDLPVLSNNSEDWYVVTGIPAADLPRTIEASTFAARDVDAELADLSTSVPRVIQAYRSGFFEAVDLRQVPCATVGETWTAPPEVLAGFELAVVDVSGCAR
jgi:hypothetical protein